MGTDERSTIRVLIANDHPVICEGLRLMLSETSEFELVAQPTSMPETMRMGISEPTVKSHLVAIYFKLGVDSRASAVAVAMERGLLAPQIRHL